MYAYRFNTKVVYMFKALQLSLTKIVNKKENSLFCNKLLLIY